MSPTGLWLTASAKLKNNGSARAFDIRRTQRFWTSSENSMSLVGAYRRVRVHSPLADLRIGTSVRLLFRGTRQTLPK